MESNEPRRRGRPPMDANPLAKTSEAEGTSTPAATPRRRRASVGGHKLKLSAPQRPGFIRRFVNDDGNNIAERQELAYDFVTDTSIEGTGEGSRVSRLVGTKANGEPLRAFLMETPVEEYRAGIAEKEAINRQIDDAINRGEDTTGRLGPASEQYGEGSIKHR